MDFMKVILIYPLDAP